MLLVALSTIYETQGTFSVPIYLKNFPKLGKDFEPFAFKGMLDFMSDLEDKCPRTAEFKNFFAKLKDYMATFNSTSPGSKDIQFELSIKSEKLYRAMSAFNRTTEGTLVRFNHTIEIHMVYKNVFEVFFLNVLYCISGDRRILGGWWMA